MFQKNNNVESFSLANFKTYYIATVIKTDTGERIDTQISQTELKNSEKDPKDIPN